RLVRARLPRQPDHPGSAGRDGSPSRRPPGDRGAALEASALAMTATHLAFCIRRSGLTRRVLIPKYYDPDIATSLDLAGHHFDLVHLGDVLLPGDEGSRLGTWLRRDLYGSGDVPYVRTSDLSHWRIRPDLKKGVAASVFEQVKVRQDVRTGDLLMVADGTYLVGPVAS